MACGVPVIATRSGAIPEYVPDGVAGLLVPEGDLEALAGAILTLLEDEALRRRLGGQGRAYALAHYDARQHVAAAEALWLELTSR
jgi:glycosyltransferase involved in cell wall biosynthesis